MLTCSKIVDAVLCFIFAAILFFYFLNWFVSRSDDNDFSQIAIGFRLDKPWGFDSSLVPLHRILSYSFDIDYFYIKNFYYCSWSMLNLSNNFIAKILPSFPVMLVIHTSKPVEYTRIDFYHLCTLFVPLVEFFPGPSW